MDPAQKTNVEKHFFSPALHLVSRHKAALDFYPLGFLLKFDGGNFHFSGSWFSCHIPNIQALVWRKPKCHHASGHPMSLPCSAEYYHQSPLSLQLWQAPFLSVPFRSGFTSIPCYWRANAVLDQRFSISSNKSMYASQETPLFCANQAPMVDLKH